MARGFNVSGVDGSTPGTAERITFNELRREEHSISSASTSTTRTTSNSSVCHAFDNWLDGFKVRALTTNVKVRGGSAVGNGKSYFGGGGNAGDGLDAFAGGDTFILSDFTADENDGNGITIKTDTLTRDEPATYGYVRNVQVTNSSRGTTRSVMA
jgi:hypothetical protein